MAGGTQEDEESTLMTKFTLVLSRLDDLEANQDEIKKILEWSDYKSKYEAYTRTIKVLFDDAKDYLENPHNSVLKGQLKYRTASDTSVDEFYNFVMGNSRIQKDTFFEAAFQYFDHDMRKTEALMKDSISRLIQGMVVQMVAPLASDYSEIALDNHLHLLNSKWQLRMNTSLNVTDEFQNQATRNAIDYITTDTNMFFERYSDKSDHSISYLRRLLENELNTKYYYTNTSVVVLEDDHYGSCVYSRKPQYTCDGNDNRKPGCPEGRNFAIFTYPSKYEQVPEKFFIDVSKQLMTNVPWNFSRGLGYTEFIADTMFRNYTRIVINKTREYALPTSKCFVETEQELEVQDRIEAYNFITLVDVCSSIGEPTLTRTCNREVKTQNSDLVFLWFLVLLVAISMPLIIFTVLLVMKRNQ